MKKSIIRFFCTELFWSFLFWDVVSIIKEKDYKFMKHANYIMQIEFQIVLHKNIYMHNRTIVKAQTNPVPAVICAEVSITAFLLCFLFHVPALPPLSVCHSDSLIVLLLPGNLRNISALWSFGSHHPRLGHTLETVTLWFCRPNLMGHQSPNPPQPAQWISATRIWSHAGPSQRPFRPSNCKSEVATLGPRPAWVYP